MTKIFIIAEAGVNHNGSIDLAKKLVDEAVEAGCDAVKFQTFKSENLVSKSAQMAEYQKENLGANDTQLSMLKKLELSYDEFNELKAYADEKGIVFISTPFDIESVRFLNSIGVKMFKIPSGEITNLPYLREINESGKDIILSTGMATLEEVNSAINELKNCKVTLLHCTTDYPCPYEEVNLNAMLTLKEQFNLDIGYSDHTEGIVISVMAAAMGAKVIEKHFTLDKTMEGPDHKASLEPSELKKLVQSIRTVEKAFGQSVKEPTACERKNIEVVRKSIVAKRHIKKGERFCHENLTTKRPATGISPMKWDEVIGQVAKRDYTEDELIE